MRGVICASARGDLLINTPGGSLSPRPDPPGNASGDVQAVVCLTATVRLGIKRSE